MKRIVICLSIVLMSLVSVFSTYSKQSTVARNRWVQVGDKWRYEVGSGSGNYVSDKFRGIFDSDGVTQKIYYFDYAGFMVTGPIVIREALYVFGSDGAAITTGFDIDGVHYQTAENGKVLGLPAGFNIYVYPRAYTVNDNIVMNTDPATYYDSNNNIAPAEQYINQ